MDIEDGSPPLDGIPLQLPPGESPLAWGLPSACPFSLTDVGFTRVFVRVSGVRDGMWIVEARGSDGLPRVEVVAAPTTAEERQVLLDLACEMVGVSAVAQPSGAR